MKLICNARNGIHCHHWWQVNDDSRCCACGETTGHARTCFGTHGNFKQIGPGPWDWELRLGANVIASGQHSTRIGMYAALIKHGLRERNRVRQVRARARYMLHRIGA